MTLRQGLTKRARSFHVELSLQHFYEGAANYLELLAWLRAHAFEPVDIVPRAVQGGLLGEADCLLRRTGRYVPSPTTTTPMP